jgi:hypothetical protein
MAYSGTTAGTTSSNPPRQIFAGMANVPQTTGLSTAPASPSNQGGGLWYYSSTNLTTDIVASNFFSDGYYLGMRPGDAVFGVQFTSAGSSVTTFFGAVTGVSTSGASLSTGSLVTSTFG